MIPTPHVGAVVVRNDAPTGPQMLVTTTSGDIAECQWWTADHELRTERIPVADLSVRVIASRRAAHANELAANDIAETKAAIDLQNEAEIENAARDAAALESPREEAAA